MSQSFLATARETSIQPPLYFLGMGKVASAESLLQRDRCRYCENVDETACGTEHQTREQRSKCVVDIGAAIDFVIERFKMLKICKHFFERDDSVDRCELAGEF